MNICRFNKDRLGAVEGGMVYDVTAALRALPAPTWPGTPGDSLILHFDALKRAIAEVRPNAASHALADVKLFSPIAAPPKIMAAPANYVLHALEAKDPAIGHGFHDKQLEGVARPVDTLGIFLKASTSIVGASQGVALKYPGRRNDHEVELCCVIGRGGRDIPRAKAFDHIMGYFIGLDMTVRGTEDRSWRKSVDSYTVFGPWLTTAEAVKDPNNLNIWISVNGAIKQKSSTAALPGGIAELIEMCSSVYELFPGDVLMTGTPEGVSQVKPGDVMMAGGDGLGEMRVDVRAYSTGA